MSVYAYAKPSSRFSYSNGGAICLTRSFCNLTFCEFSNYTVTGDASKYSNLGYGGGIYANISSIVIVNSCQFNHKGLRNVGPSLDYASTMSGGSFFLNTYFNCSDCEFINHRIYVNTPSSDAYGGAIYSSGYANIKICKFINSSAIVDQDKYNSKCGAIYIIKMEL